MTDPVLRQMIQEICNRVQDIHQHTVPLEIPRHVVPGLLIMLYQQFVALSDSRNVMTRVQIVDHKKARRAAQLMSTYVLQKLRNLPQRVPEPPAAATALQSDASCQGRLSTHCDRAQTHCPLAARFGLALCVNCAKWFWNQPLSPYFVLEYWQALRDSRPTKSPRITQRIDHFKHIPSQCFGHGLLIFTNQYLARLASNPHLIISQQGFRLAVCGPHLRTDADEQVRLGAIQSQILPQILAEQARYTNICELARRGFTQVPADVAEAFYTDLFMDHIFIDPAFAPGQALIYNRRLVEILRWMLCLYREQRLVIWVEQKPIDRRTVPAHLVAGAKCRRCIACPRQTLQYELTASEIVNKDVYDGTLQRAVVIGLSNPATFSLHTWETLMRKVTNPCCTLYLCDRPQPHFTNELSPMRIIRAHLSARHAGPNIHCIICKLQL